MRKQTPETATTTALSKNADDLAEAEKYIAKLQDDRVTLVAACRADGVTWRSIEELTGTTRQTLTKGIDR